MLFNSVAYLAFLPLVFVACFNLPPALRPGFLLLASWISYASWKPAYLGVLVGLTLVDYLAALALEKSAGPRARRRLWLASLAANLGILFAFKYAGFFGGELGRLSASWAGFWSGGDAPLLGDLLLPIGLSIHTLQAIGYATDVYRGHHAAERSFVRFALFISWFPQLTSGPIERASTLLDRLRAGIRLPTGPELREGAALIALGFFKKLVIADNLLTVVGNGFDNLDKAAPSVTLLAVYAFAVQLCFDFSGYTDIARGSSLLFGIRLSPNFDRPFLATSIPEFWRRWHMTLSGWFFEYVYFPLVRAWPSRGGAYLAAVVVFTLAGLWHGASWTFLLWGFLSGLLYCASSAASPWLRPRGTLSTWALRALVFHAVAFLWIFFRAVQLSDVPVILRHCAEALSSPARSLGELAASPQLLYLLRALSGLAALPLLLPAAGPSVLSRAAWRTPAALAAAAVLILSLGRFTGETFVYFQF